MNIQGTIKDRYATIVIDGKAVKLHQPGHYRLTVKGLPTIWNEEHALNLITKCLKKQGFTSITLRQSSATFTKWHASISFYYPSEVSLLQKR